MRRPRATSVGRGCPALAERGGGRRAEARGTGPPVRAGPGCCRGRRLHKRRARGRGSVLFGVRPFARPGAGGRGCRQPACQSGERVGGAGREGRRGACEGGRHGWRSEGWGQVRAWRTPGRSVVGPRLPPPPSAPPWGRRATGDGRRGPPSRDLFICPL